MLDNRARHCTIAATLDANKGNLGNLPPSLAFRLVEDGASGVARVAWEGETRWTAAQLLRASEEGGGEDRSVLGEARQWLREALADGARPVKEIEQEAKEHGITITTLKAARKAEAVITHKEPIRKGRWLISLPPAAAAQRREGDEAAASPPLTPLTPLHPPRSALGDGYSEASELAGSEPTAPPSPRSCIECGTALTSGQRSPCGPCFANALTDDG